MRNVHPPLLVAPRWKKLVCDVRAESGRLILMLTAIAVSLVAVGTVLGAFAILTREIATNYLGTRPASAALEIEGGVGRGLVDRVRDLPEVADAEARGGVLARVQVGEGWRPMLLFVIDDFQAMRLNTFRRERGAWPPPPGTLLVERSALRVVGADVGASLMVKVPGGAPRPLQISGVVHDPGLAPAWQEREGYGYVTPATLELLGAPPTLHELRVAFRGVPRDIRVVEGASGRLAAWLGQEGHPVHEIRVPPPGQHPHQRQMTTLLYLILAFAFLALVLSAILVASSLAAMLARQVREIGIMKSIGARSSQIGWMYALLVSVLGALSVAIALPGGVAGARVLSRAVAGLLNFELTSVALPWWAYAAVALAGVLVPLALAAAPIRAASRATVRQAIDQHGVSADVLHPRLSALPYGLRNAVRRPRRTVLTLGLLAAGGAMFMTALNLSRGWERTVAKIARTRFYDVEVRLHDAAPSSLADGLRRLPGVRDLEAWGYSPAAFGRPGQIDVVHTYPDRSHGGLSVLAPPPGTKLVHFPVLAGRWLAPGDTDAVVLNHSALAQQPGLRLGDRVVLSLEGRPTAWRLVGVIEEIGSPGVGYVSDAAYASAAGTPDRARLLRIATTAPSGSARFADDVRGIERALTQQGAGVDMVIPLSELRSAIGGHVQLLIQSLMAMAVVIAIVGTLSLGSTMSIGVVERTREIGIMSALGATPARILRTVVSEASFIAGLSWALAVALALPLTAGLDWLVGMLGFLAPLPFSVAAAPIAFWLALVMLVGLVATLIPARAASSITVREALGRL